MVELVMQSLFPKSLRLAHLLLKSQGYLDENFSLLESVNTECLCTLFPGFL